MLFKFKITTPFSLAFISGLFFFISGCGSENGSDELDQGNDKSTTITLTKEWPPQCVRREGSDEDCASKTETPYAYVCKSEVKQLLQESYAMQQGFKCDFFATVYPVGNIYCCPFVSVPQ